MQHFATVRQRFIKDTQQSMNKTISEFATELGKNKSTISRVLKKLGIEIEASNGQAKMLNEAAQLAIRQHFDYGRVITPNHEETGLVILEQNSLSLAPVAAVEDIKISLTTLDTSALDAQSQALQADNEELERMLMAAAEHFASVEANALLSKAKSHKEQLKRSKIATAVKQINTKQGM